MPVTASEIAAAITATPIDQWIRRHLPEPSFLDMDPDEAMVERRRLRVAHCLPPMIVSVAGNEAATTVYQVLHRAIQSDDDYDGRPDGDLLSPAGLLPGTPWDWPLFFVWLALQHPQAETIKPTPAAWRPAMTGLLEHILEHDAARWMASAPRMTARRVQRMLKAESEIAQEEATDGPAPGEPRDPEIWAPRQSPLRRAMVAEAAEVVAAVFASASQAA